MYTLKDIAIVILNWNGKHLLKTFLPSVLQHSGKSAIYIADNASNDGSVDFIKTNYPSINIIQNTDNYGYAKGYNDALTSVSEPLLCLLNNDIEVSEAWLTPMLNEYNSNAETAILQPKILDYNTRTSFEYAGAAGGLMDKYGYPYCRGRVFDTIEKDIGQYNENHEILWASGACFFIKNDVFKLLNGFDASFFAHMEEIDLCWRAYNKGYKISYVATSKVYHLGGGTLQTLNPKKTYLNFRNSLITLVKNTDKNVFNRVFIRLCLDGIAGLRFISQNKINHCFAIIKAHFAFYKALPTALNFRKQHKQKIKFYTTNSIVWDYFIKHKKEVN